MGRLLGLILGVQLLTGLFISMHYCPSSIFAFDSVVHLVHDVNLGWLLRSVHANGASFFFLVIYCHIGRSLYFGSYSLRWVWFSGVLLLLILIAISFLGYVLPWGQIRYWGATVITSLFSALPYIGSDLVLWIWGSFTVDNPTLTRFYSLHFLLPFILTALAGIHIFYLHRSGSSNPLGLTSCSDKIPFHRYYLIKDIYGFSVLASIFLFVVLFCPNLFMEPDNFIPANPLSTPSHIVPEWYFLFAYAILRSVPRKLGGVLAIFGSLFVLLLLSFLPLSAMKPLRFYGPVKGLFWGFIRVFVFLTLAGSWPVVVPFVFVSRVMTIFYFAFFFLIPIIRFLFDCLLSFKG